VREIWTLGVEDLVQAIHAGELDAVEVVRAFAERAAEVDGLVNCFITLDGAAATERAAGLGPGSPGPLHCVPYAYKDVFVHGGATPSVGSRDVSLPVRGRASPVLDRLDAAGAIALGACNLDPFAYAATGVNPDFGDTLNPWDPTRIAGGSSGGAAAAVAAGAVPFAVGTDAGGSIRIPAALCGVTGLKPTLGRIPRRGAVPLTYSQDTVGILARSARDVALVLGTVAGHDPDDPSSIPAPVPAYAVAHGGCEGLRIGVDTDAFAARTMPQIATTAESVLGVFTRLGAELIEVDLALLEGFDAAAAVLTWAEALAIHERGLETQTSRYPPTIRARLESALAVHGADHVNALRLQGRSIAQLLEGPLSTADVLLVPTVSSSAVTFDALRRDAVGVSIGHLRLNRPFNFAGVPALAFPAGFDADGLPVGLQLVGRPWAEEQLLACVAAYQEATDWHRRLPPLPPAHLE